MYKSHDEQWTRREVAFIKTTTIGFSCAVVILPFLIPRQFLDAWPSAITIYEYLSVVFPYLAWSLPLSNDPDFYIISKLVLFLLGFAFVLTIGVFPLSKNIVVNEIRIISEAGKALWWFWLLFGIFGYIAFFWMYRSDTNLSWASKAAVGSDLGVALGNFAQFGVFALLALYVLLLRQYLRLRSIWDVAHGRKQSQSA